MENKNYWASETLFCNDKKRTYTHGFLGSPKNYLFNYAKEILRSPWNSSGCQDLLDSDEVSSVMTMAMCIYILLFYAKSCQNWGQKKLLT